MLDSWSNFWGAAQERTVKHGRQKAKDRAARPRDAVGTGIDRTENGAAPYEEFFSLLQEDAH